MAKKLINNARFFTREGRTAEILQEVILSVPPKTRIYVVGGAARNLVYYDLFKKPLPQRDYDLLLVGDLKKFVENLRAHKFIYGKIRRTNDVVLKKGLIPGAKLVTDYLVLDIHRSHQPNILQNLKDSSAFSINGFAVPLRYYLSKNFRKYLVSLPTSTEDLKNKRLRLNIPGYTKHSGNLFACLRFMSAGFKAPSKKEVQLLLERLPKLEKWRFERNVKKVFRYVGGEKKARQLTKKLGIEIDIFDLKKLRQFASK